MQSSRSLNDTARTSSSYLLAKKTCDFGVEIIIFLANELHLDSRMLSQALADKLSKLLDNQPPI
eukprot:7832443-Karenia_brevis.AAC.1